MDRWEFDGIEAKSKEFEAKSKNARKTEKVDGVIIPIELFDGNAGNCRVFHQNVVSPVVPIRQKRLFFRVEFGVYQGVFVEKVLIFLEDFGG